jgi:O-antigen/teichoic acid export membrane protein
LLYLNFPHSVPVIDVFFRGNAVSVARNSSYNLLAGVIPLIVSFVTVPVYIRLVGLDRYGVLSIAWLLLGYFGLFDLGLGRATSFRIAALHRAAPGARANTFWAALFVNIAMGVLGGAILWGAAELFFSSFLKVKESLRPEILSAVPYLALTVPVATLAGILSGAMQGRQKFFEVNAISVTSTIVFQLLPLALAWAYGPNLVRILIAALAARLLSVIALGWLCYRDLLRGNAIRILRNEVRLLLGYGGWVTLTGIVSPFLNIADRFVIGAVTGASAVTVYTVPFQLAKQIAIVPGSLTNALFPKLSAAHPAEQKKLSEKATLTLAAMIGLPILIGIFLLQPFLVLWLGRDIGQHSAPTGRVLLMAFWANAFALVPFTRLQASGRPDLVAKILLLEIPPYFLALYFGLHYFGIVGAALAFAGRCMLDYSLLSWIAEKRLVGFPILGGNLLALTAAAWACQLWQWNDPRLWIMAAALCSAILFLTLYGLPAQTRKMLQGRASRLLEQGLRRP